MTPNQIRELSQTEYQAWFDANYPKLHNRTPYHHSAWMEAVARGVHFEARYAGIFDGREMVAALPGFLTRRGPFRLYGSPLRGTLTSTLGPVSLQPIDPDGGIVELITLCSRFIQRQWGAQYTRFTVRDGPQQRYLGLDSNWEQQRPSSYRLDLCAGEEALWNGLKSDCRRNIRRAEQFQIEVAPFDDARLLFRMVDDTYRRHGTTSFQQEQFFRNVVGELIPKDLLWAWSASFEGKTIAACLFLHDDREVHFISGGSLPEYGNLPTSYILHWTAIRAAAKAGLEVYNSDASQIRSIDQFKESFRPILKDRYTLIYSPAPVRLAQKAFITGSTYLRRVRRLV